MNWPILSWIVFLPLLGVLAILLTGKTRINAIRWTALAVSFLDFILTIIVFQNFSSSNIEMQFRDGPILWIKSLGITYSLGVDGISLLLVILTPFLSIIAIAST